MSPANPNMSQHEQDEHDSPSNLPPQSPWKTIWHNNKGALLILISEVFGASMDATARFLQQGGHGMHPFQVATLLTHVSLMHMQETNSQIIDHLCTNGHDVHSKHNIYVVDEST